MSCSSRTATSTSWSPPTPSTTPASSDRLRRPVLHRRPGHHGQERQQRHHRRRRPRRQEGVQRAQLDAGQRSRSRRRRPSSPTRDLLAVQGRPPRRPLDAVSTDNSILLGFIAADPTAPQAGRQPVHRRALRHRPEEGRRRLPHVRQRPLEETYANGEWAAAFESTLGELGIPTPTPPPVNRYASAGPAPADAPRARRWRPPPPSRRPPPPRLAIRPYSVAPGGRG